MKDNNNNSCPAVLSTKMSMCGCGKGKSSLGLALLRSRKSTHMRTLPSFFGTGTLLANHSGYSVTTRNPAFSCFSTSSLMKPFSFYSAFSSVSAWLAWHQDTKRFYAKLCLCWVQAYHRRTMQRHPCIVFFQKGNQAYSFFESQSGSYPNLLGFVCGP